MDELKQKTEFANYYLSADDGVQLHVLRWLPHSSITPAAVMLITHGMAEHAARYDTFAKMLNEQGIIVYAHDLRGHGMTAQNDLDLGHLADEHGWSLVMRDLRLIHRHIRQEHAEVPIVFLGHSFGSFLVRKYIQQQHQDIAGVILSGTGGSLGIPGVLGKMLTNGVIRRHGVRYNSIMLNNLIFGPYNRPFRPNRTAFDWLSRDQHEVDQYIDDDRCGFLCSAGFIRDLIAGVMGLYKKGSMKNMPAALPIFIFSGSKDPVGKNGKGVLETVKQFRNAGLHQVSFTLYEDGRHEMLHEINREEVFQDVIRWIKAKIILY